MGAVITPQGSHLLAQSFLMTMYKNDAFKQLLDSPIGQWIPANYGLLKGYVGLCAAIAEHTTLVNSYNAIPIGGLTSNILNHTIGTNTLKRKLWSYQEYAPLNQLTKPWIMVVINCQLQASPPRKHLQNNWSFENLEPWSQKYHSSSGLLTLSQDQSLPKPSKGHKIVCRQLYCPWQFHSPTRVRNP